MAEPSPVLDDRLVTSTILKPTLLRVVVLSVAMFAYLALVPTIFADSTDALGPGLLAFLGLFVASGIWAIVDSHRASRTGTVLLRWLLVGLLVGVVQTVHFVFFEKDATGEMVADDLAFMVFFTLLILIPATVGAVLGIIGRRPAGTDDVAVSHI